MAFFSTGDELRSIGQTLQEGEIYDSNRYTLYSMLERLGVTILDMGVVADDPEAIRSALEMTDWNISKAARRLGISRWTMYRRFQKYNISRPTDNL